MSGLAEQYEPGVILDTVLETCRSFVLLCDARGTIAYENPAALQLFGRAESAFERDGLFDMPTNRKDRQLLQDTTRNLMMGERKRLEMVLHSIEGLHVPASLVLCRIADAAGGEARILVIGDPAEAIAAVSYVSSIASNNLVIRMLHGSVDPVFLLDPRTRIVRDCNPAAAALFGWSRREFIGANLQKLFPNKEAFLEIGKRLSEFESKAGIHEEEILLKGLDNGPISCKLTSLCIFGPKGNAELRVAMLHDITEAHIREDMLVRLATRSSELAAELTQLTKHQIPIGRESFTDMGFTERQAQLAKYAAIGLTSKEMAYRLGLSESTVKNHFSAMFRKFGVTSRIELIALLSDRRVLPK
jgi:PAS domain S-box-containing protein